jgi:hypothetical protein
MSKHTLHLTWPLGKTLILALPFVAILLGIGEIMLRQQFVQAYFDTPVLSNRHRHLDRQWHRLETLTKSGVVIDCIALGNSMILNAFDPQLFAQSFQSQTGRPLTCFNFGVDALTPVSAGALAQILIDTYHPQLLIFGTDARDFAISPDSEETSVIMDAAWIQYRLGKFSLEGWLVDHSYLYRYRYRLADFVRLKPDRRVDTPDNKFGFEPLDTTAIITIPPDPNDSSYHIQYYYRVLGDYTIQPDNLTALKQILDQKDRAAVIVVEMPVPETYFYFFDNPEAEYRSFVDTLNAITSDYQVLFLETTSQHLIPDDSWMDYSHVNYKGAHLLSEWLGQQIGKAFADGKVTGLKP